MAVEVISPHSIIIPVFVTVSERKKGKVPNRKGDQEIEKEWEMDGLTHRKQLWHWDPERDEHRELHRRSDEKE